MWKWLALAILLAGAGDRSPTPTREQARRTEFQNVAVAVTALVVENKLASIPNPIASDTGCTNGSKDMAKFPDNTSHAVNEGKLKDPNGKSYTPGDKAGYVLYGHDITANNSSGLLTNYVNFQNATYCYKADFDGTVHQYNEAGVEQTQ
jgi:hypothetical protein